MTALFPLVLALALPVRDFVARWSFSAWRRRIHVPPMSAAWLHTHECAHAKRGDPP